MGRNPLDTAGTDTDDGKVWMGGNPDYADYVEQATILVDSKRKKASPKKEHVNPLRPFGDGGGDVSR